MTDAERILWSRLRASQFGVRFRRQEPIGDYIVDFVCLPFRLIIEVDGSQHLDSVYDEARDLWLRSLGFRVLRFWNHEVLLSTDDVMAHIGAVLRGEI